MLSSTGNTELLPEIAERAHRSGHRVSTHVETAADFRHAVLHGVRIAIGSDRYDVADASEARALHNLGVFSNLELLKMWCETTPATIFPDRKIGHLQDGYEASFLVLNGNSLEDFMSVEKIEMRVKEGELSNLESTEDNR